MSARSAVAGLPVGGGYTRGGAAGRPGFGAFDPRGPPPPMPPNFDRGFQQRGGYGDGNRDHDRRTGYGFDRPANGSAHGARCDDFGVRAWPAPGAGRTASAAADPRVPRWPELSSPCHRASLSSRSPPTTKLVPGPPIARPGAWLCLVSCARHGTACACDTSSVRVYFSGWDGRQGWRRRPVTRQTIAAAFRCRRGRALYLSSCRRPISPPPSPRTPPSLLVCPALYLRLSSCLVYAWLFGTG